MILRHFALTVVAALIIGASTVRADVISSFVNTEATGGTYVNLAGVSPTETPPANSFALDPVDTDDTGYVRIDATMTGNPSIGQWMVTTANSSDSVDYFFTVNLTNQTGGDMGPVTVELLDGSLVVGTGSTVRFRGIANSTWHTPPTVENSLIAFGADGGTLAHGESGTLQFQFRIAQNAPPGTFHFRLTATPEPTSLIFGAIGVSVAGGIGVYVKRRRSKSAPQDTPASAV